MKAKVIEQLSKHTSLTKASRILVAFSGGMDSAALLHLLKDTDIQTGVAHANFQLRGEESDGDENFAKSLAQSYGLPFYTKRFNTQEYAVSNRISVQMAARKLRYAWFEELSGTENWDFVATAHHMDDQIETFFINLLRGTGISGLKGIPAISHRIIRPMLILHRSEIEEYVRKNRLDYREDSSNFKSDYLRNRIRHQLLPLIGEMQPAYRKIMAGNMLHLAEAGSFMRDAAAELIGQIVKTETNEIRISVTALLKSAHPRFLLYEILTDYGFLPAQVSNIWNTIKAQPGKIFYSEGYRLVKDRKHLIVQPLKETGLQEEVFQVDAESGEVLAPIHLRIEVLSRDLDFHPSADPHKAFLDFDTLQFPMLIRKWKQGDKFKPLGMKGRMKLSDFFTANKFSIAEKEKTWLLADANDEIVWIIGYRISEKFRIRPSTKLVYAITWIY